MKTCICTLMKDGHFLMANDVTWRLYTNGLFDGGSSEPIA